MSRTQPAPAIRATFPLHIHITTLFLGLVLAVGLLLTFLSYQRNTRIVERATGDVFERIARETVAEFSRVADPVDATTQLLARHELVRATTLSQRLQSLAYCVTALRSNPNLTSLYTGHDNGDFFLVRRITTPEEARTLSAPAGTAFVVQSIERAAGLAEYLYYDADLLLVQRTPQPTYLGYDPRQRPWYALAARDSKVHRSAPYVFFATGHIGFTLSQRSPIATATVGADIQLDTLAALLQRQRVTPSTEMLIFDGAGAVLAYPDGKRAIRREQPGSSPRLARIEELGVPVLARIARDGVPDSGPQRFSDPSGEGWRVALHRLDFQAARPDDKPFFLALAVPEGELLAEVRETRRNALLVFSLLLALSVPLTIFAARLVARPLERLASEAEAVRHFDFSRPQHVRSVVKEVDDLAATMDGMKATIRRFIDITSSVAAEDDFSRLLPSLLKETTSAAGAHSGVLYLASGGGALLTPAALRSHDQSRGIEDAAPQPLGDVPAILRETVSTLHARALAGHVTSQEADQSGLSTLGISLTQDKPVIAVALHNRKHQLVGAMLLFGASEVGHDRLSFITALSGSAAVSLETRELINAQKELFEAFIRLMASAIDAKSPYTGGHCARVPELTKMLARAACDAQEGPYKDFQLTPDEWEAVHVAGWLHDSGKITTPEYVVDKATKLETIYDRIHEVRMRFEVLKRDAEIECLKRMLAGEDADRCAAGLSEQLRILDEEFTFVATCNEGGEFMAPEKIERLKQIASRTWQRTLDDRIGIAHEEKARKAREPAAALPATELLLADRPEHRIPRRDAERIDADNPWGFQLKQPELLYNRGELYNLSVSRGTLSEEERYKINDHIVQTIIMLSALPFPKHLQCVPELAGGHHEKMDGTGYPKRLTREQMSPVARMMAIADIFEALTAADRPYKKGKTLSESLKIMSFMRKDQHIDAELFELFLRSGVYLDYARRFMRPEQIDAVDIHAYL